MRWRRTRPTHTTPSAIAFLERTARAAITAGRKCTLTGQASISASLESGAMRFTRLRDDRHLMLRQCKSALREDSPSA